MIEITTQRLVLRPLGTKYLETVHVYASDIENTRYMMRLPNDSIEETQAFLEGAEKEWESEHRSFYEFAIIYEGKHVGAVSIYLEDDAGGELGWIINKACWRQGIAYEAATALLAYAKEALGIRRFIAHCDAENEASYRIMEKLGMIRTGAYGGRRNKSSDEDRMEYQYELFI